MSERVSENQPQEQAEAAALAPPPSPPPAPEGNGKAPPQRMEEPLSTTNLAAPPLAVSKREWQRLIALILASAAACLFFWQVQSALMPFLIAFFLASLLDPSVRYMEQHGRSRIYAIFILYLLALSMFGVFLRFIVPPAFDQITELGKNYNTYYTNVTKTTDALLERNHKTLQMLGIKQKRISELLNQSPIRDMISSALGGLTGFLQGAASKILWIIIIPVATFFFLRDYPILRARIISLFPEAYHAQIDTMSREIVDVFGAYLRGLAKVCALFGLLAVLLFKLFGLKYWLFLGLLAGVFYAVPYVGQLFTSVISGAVAYSMGAHTALFFVHVRANSIGYALTVVLCAIIAQNLFDQIVYPRVVGASVGLHPVISIFALMAGATLFGIVGMLIAVPVAASIQILLMFFFPKLTQKPPAALLEPTPPVA